MAPKTPNPKLAAGYLRVSRARDEMIADSDYRQQIESYAAAYGYRLVRIYEDLDFSGRKGSRARPQFSELLEQADAGMFGLLIVPKLSRFGRSMRDNLAAYDRLEAAGVGLAFLDLRVDTSTSGGKLMRNMLTALAEYESDLISDRWKDTHAYLARNGRTNGSPAYGYSYSSASKKLRPKASEARIVREVYRRFGSGESGRSIAADLQRRAIPGVEGEARSWSASHVLRMLDNPIYAGYRQLKWHRSGLDPEKRVEGEWKPLVDRELFERVETLRAATKARTPAERREGKGRSLLAGLLFCVCGEPMWHNPAKPPRSSTYDCRAARAKRRGECEAGSVSARRAEPMVVSEFLERVSSSDYRSRALKMRRKAARPQRSADHFDRRIAAIDRRVDQLIEAQLSAGGRAGEAFQRKLQAADEERAAIERERAEQRAAGITESHEQRNLEMFLKRISSIESVWERGTPQQRNEMLRLGIERVDVVTTTRPKELKISWAPWLAA